MKRQLFYIASLLTLLCCSNHPGEVKIHGEFAHLEQGEFYIYSSDNGLDHLDTLRIESGEFDYKLSLEGDATLHLLYPNFSKLTIFASSGDDIDIEGDAQNLNEVKVSGSEDNEVYTQFRRETAEQAPEQVREAARSYMLEHPTLQMSRYLLSTHYLLDPKAPTSEAKEIFDSLCRACPDDISLTKMATAVNTKDILQRGKQLPKFKLKLRPPFTDRSQEGRTVTNADYKGAPLLICFWAGWKSGTQSALYRARRIRNEMNGKPIGLISYSLDSSEELLRDIEARDSINYASYCDHLCFSSPLVEQWGIRDLPFFVLTDANGKIIASGNEWMRDIEPHVGAIKK